MGADGGLVGGLVRQVKGAMGIWNWRAGLRRDICIVLTCGHINRQGTLQRSSVVLVSLCSYAVT